MSAVEHGYQDSLWGGPETKAERPKRCPHCDRELAHPDDLRDNDDIEARGLFSAYRAHRRAHFEWGDDPRDDGERYGDPYLGNYYDNDRDATWEPDEEDEDDTHGDPKEVVGHVYDVELKKEATVRARVVAPDERTAKEKADELHLMDEPDLNGHVPTAELTMDLHEGAFELKDVHRADTDLAERMEGWPW